MKILFPLVLILLMHVSAYSELKMPEIFTNHMVLQCGKPVKVWGKSDPMASVTVKFGKYKITAKSDDAGKWNVVLPPMVANSFPQTMTIQSDKNKIILKDIMVGEVWLASGQSNMEYNMGVKWLDGSDGKNLQPKHAENIQLRALDKIKAFDKDCNGSAEPLLRIFRVQRTLNADSLPTLGWQTVDSMSIENFSACAYFFAKNLCDSLKIPVGIMTSCWGGTKIDTWKDADGQHYKKLIAPMIPFTFRGFLWYQGESDIAQEHFEEYYNMQGELIDNWRKEFADGEQIPFYFVQIAPHYYSHRRKDPMAHSWDALPRFQMWQDKVARDKTNVDMIVISDLVDEGMIHDIHPTFKWEVGRRLANLALRGTYGHENLIVHGPEVKKWKVSGNEITVEFECHGSSLTTRDGKDPNYFEVLDDRKKWYEAEARIEGNKIVLTTSLSRHPLKHFRLAWDESYQTNLCNREGLPANIFNSTFRYDIGTGKLR